MCTIERLHCVVMFRPCKLWRCTLVLCGKGNRSAPSRSPSVLASTTPPPPPPARAEEGRELAGTDTAKWESKKGMAPRT